MTRRLAFLFGALAVVSLVTWRSAISIPGPLVVVLAVLALVAAVIWRTMREHAVIEQRARVMELLARALRRGRALPPLFGKLHEEFPRRKLWPIGCALTDGASLGDALEQADSPLFPKPWPDLVRAVEGDAGLVGMLEAESQVEARQGRFVEKLLLALVYPAVLGFGVLALNEAHGWASGFNFFVGNSDNDFGAALPIALALVAALAVLRFRRWPSWLPRPWRTDRTDRARVLRLVSDLLERGAPLHTALERVEPIACNKSVREGVARARAQAEAGEAAGDVLAFLGPDGRAQARIRGATPLSLVARLRAVAVHVEERVRRRQQHVLRGLRPSAVLVAGIVVLLGYAAFARYIAAEQLRAMPW